MNIFQVLIKIFEKFISIFQNYKVIIKNLGWLFLDKIFKLTTGILISIAFARKFGPNFFGQYNFVIAFVSLFLTLVSLGLDNILLRDFINYKRIKDWLISTTLFLRFISGIFLYIICLVLLNYFKTYFEFTANYISIYAIILILSAFDVFDLWFQSQTQSKYPVLGRLSTMIIFSLIRLILIHYEFGLKYFIYLLLIESIINSVVILFIYQTIYRKLPFKRPKKKLSINLIKESWPVLVSSVAIVIYMKIDQIMLPILSTDKQLGLYSAALKLSETWYLIPTLIINAITPYLISLNSKSNESFTNKLRKVMRTFVVFSYILASFIMFFSDRIIIFLYGTQFSEAAPILSIHIWATVFVFTGVISTPWFLLNDSLKITMYNTIIGAILNIALNLILIPELGAIGASISTFISYAFGAFILNYFYSKTKNIFYIQLKSICLVK